MWEPERPPWTRSAKYIPVRRTAMFIESSVDRGMQWAVFEPNDETLWARIRSSVASFLHDLFRQGAFEGKRPMKPGS